MSGNKKENGERKKSQERRAKESAAQGDTPGPDGATAPTLQSPPQRRAVARAMRDCPLLAPGF
ncbi:hypothetical protein P7K49_023876 [Saguinus oedipus]|uniref:Small EDRK-rich factor 2 n=1 Tax=Saguinus oedipus TaxID=9490 RepID=A0ABQ9UNR3_SAGOE|nr:hypothetical protein P7K49_023876 [Saguinus oedipus]